MRAAAVFPHFAEKFAILLTRYSHTSVIGARGLRGLDATLTVEGAVDTFYKEVLMWHNPER